MPETTGLMVCDLPMSEIFSDSHFNCRGLITPFDVRELAQSLAEVGLQSPITVQPYLDAGHPDRKWRIIAGHRRHKAASVLHWKTIPAIIRTNLSAIDALAFNLSENVHRRNLNIMQEATAIGNLRQAGLTQDQIASRLNQSKGWLQVRLQLLDLPREIQSEAAAGLLTHQQIRDIYSEADVKKQYEMVKVVKEAKERGDRVPSLRIKKKVKSALSKHPRSRSEMFDLLGHIQDTVGNNFGTRVLAWCAGEIADLEVYAAIQELANEKGIEYEIPAEVMSPLHFGPDVRTEE